MKEISEMVAAIKQIADACPTETVDEEQSFNMFRALGVERKEVYHSAFLKALLNVGPKNNKKILMSFVKDVLHRNDEADYAEVLTEKAIGNKTETEGGRIDLLIISKDQTKCIIIENKIYAGDQDNQLLRYKQYGEKEYQGRYALFYLTLRGNPASQKSTGENLKAGQDYITISYKQSILEWLMNIRDNKAIVSENVKSAIEQYIIILKQLTRRNMELEEKIKEQFHLDQMNQLDYLKKLSSAYKSTEGIMQSMKSMMDEHREKMIKELAYEYKLDFIREPTWFCYNCHNPQDGIKKIFFYDDQVGICCQIDFSSIEVKEKYLEKGLKSLLECESKDGCSLYTYQKYSGEEELNEKFCLVYNILKDILIGIFGNRK